MEGLLCPFWVCAFVVSEFGDDSLINAFRTCQLKRMEGDFMALFGAFWWTLQGSCSKGLRLGLRFISCSDCSPIIGKCSLGYLHVYLSECRIFTKYLKVAKHLSLFSYISRLEVNWKKKKIEIIS
ncbi:hypothetical protein KC19_9G103300 [Ceratodon purpureus]|uniref:Uncharacterized protein n=1 Tax=Ceratodon purpureus TaxID=3225 RepID=A0A8T0GSG1_CERPU|nr:hypothetical protein KC19_9G103300 [Ceratodon purpureus]